jgi:ParB family chromosome partitioning protein
MADELEIKRIQPNKLNPRLKFSKAGLDDLAASIRQYGILEPILVRPVNGHFEVVVGERRYRAAQQAGLDRVPVIIRDYSDDEVMEINLVENVQREDLSAVEKAKLCAELRERYPEKYRSWDAIAQRIGVEPPTVRTWMRTLGMSEALQEKIAPRDTQRVPEGKLDFRTALEIHHRIKEPERQIEVAERLARAPMRRQERDEIIRLAASEASFAETKPRRAVGEIVQEVVRETRPTMVFNHRHYRGILEGTKTQTTRRRPDPQIQKGAMVRGAVSHFADLEVMGVERKRLGEFTDIDARREGGYSLAEFKDYWQRVNGEWDPDEVVYLIQFRVAKTR